MTRTSFDVVLPEGGSGPGGLFGSCTCGQPEFYNLPCEHIMCFAKTRSFLDHELVERDHLTLTLQKQYPSELSFGDVSGAEARSKQPNESLRIAPVGPRKAGRPRTKRILPVTERNRKRPRLCAYCRQAGHDSRACPNRVQESGQHNEPDSKLKLLSNSYFSLVRGQVTSPAIVLIFLKLYLHKAIYNLNERCKSLCQVS